MNIKRLLKWTVLAVITLTVVAGILLFTMDLGFLRGTVEDRVRQATGREFSIGDGLSLKLGRDLVIHAKDVRMGNAPWAAADEFIRIGELDAVLDPRSLWNGPLLIRHVKLTQLDVSLQQTLTGEANWQFTGPGAAEEDTATELPFLVEELALAGANIEFQSPRLDQPLRVRIERMEQDLAADGQIHATVTGQLNGQPMRIEANGGPYARLVSGDDFTVDGHGNFGRIALSGSAILDNLWSPQRPVADLRLSGPDFEELTGMLGIEGLGGGDLALHATTAVNDAVLNARLVGNLGQFKIDISSEMPSLAEIIGAAFQAQVSGPNFGRIARLAGLEGWPEGPFSLATAVRRPENQLHIERFNLSLAKASIGLSGIMPAFPDMSGSDLELHISGPDHTPFRGVSGLDALPAGAFSVAGSVKTNDGGTTTVDVRYAVPLVSGALSGVLGSSKDLVGSDLIITGKGPDASAVGKIMETPGLRAVPWTLNLALSITDPLFYEISEARFSTAPFKADLSGRLGSESLDKASDLRFSVSGDRLADFQELAGEAVALPEQAFVIDGQVKAIPDAWQLTGLSGNAGPTSFRVDGRLGMAEDLSGTDLDLASDGTDLGSLIGLPGEARLPDGPFSLTSRVRLDRGRLNIGQLKIAAGSFNALLDAEMPWPVALTNGRFDLNTKGLNITRVLPELASLTLDPGAYEIRALGAFEDGRIRFEQGTVRVGESSLSVKGTVDLPPELSATNLEIEIQSPDLSKLGTIDGQRWGTVPLQLSSGFSGTATKLMMNRLQAKLGENAVKGTFAIDFAPAVPLFDLDLSATTLDLKPFMAAPTAEGTAKPVKDARLIPATAFPMETLAGIAGRFSLRADRVLLRKMSLGNTVINGELKNGGLRVSEMGLDGYAGRLTATLGLDPLAEGGASLTTSVRSKGLILNLADQSEAEKRALPAFDIDIDLAGSGKTLSEAAGVFSGGIRISSPGGRVKNAKGKSAVRLFLAEVLSAISPSAARQEEINISCVAALMDVKNGMVLLDPGIALQSDKLNLFAGGKINLATEKLDVSFRSKTRKTVDMSASELVSPYVKLSGTLAKPSVALDPKGTLLSGGAAYLSGGLSILAKKALDQIGGTGDPCADILKEKGDG